MKKTLSLIFIASLLLSCTNSPELKGNGELLLNDGWKLTCEKVGKTFTVAVPSTVAGALTEVGYYPANILESDNYKNIDKSIFDETWTYTTTFKVDRSAENYSLVFDGLNYYADIFFNGQQIAASDTTKGVFIKRVYDVTSLIKGNNKIEVKLRKAQTGDLNIGFVDWNPRPLDESMGIVRPVHLRACGALSIDDVYVKPHLDLDGFKSAELEVMVTLHNYSDKDIEATLALALCEDAACDVPVSVPAGETSEIILTSAQAANLHIDNPRVWWTWDLGTPEMYSIDVKCLVGGNLSDENHTDFGIKEITSRLVGKDYRQFTLNGRDILIKGAGWTDDIFLRDTKESIELQVRYVKDMNMNCIRFENIWGKDDTPYDLCDKYGLLAMVGWSCQWEWESYCGIPEKGRYGCIYTPELEDLATRYFHDQVIRLHNHPSIYAWLTGSDGIPNPQLEERYMAIYNRYEYRPYVCSAKELESKFGGKSGTKMEGPYEYVGPEYWYLDTKVGGAFGFNTETCVGASIPQKESILKMIPADSLWPLSSIWDFHCTTSSSDMHATTKMQEVINGNYGGFDSLDDFLMKAYAVDYNGVRAMFEAFRANVPNTTGIVQWMLNSAWPSLYWQVYDWYGVPAAGYYGVKKACEPIQLIFNYKDRKVYAVNETGASAAISASFTIFDENSNIIGSSAANVCVANREPKAVFDLAQFDGKPHFIALSLTKESGEKVDNFYCIAAKDNVHQFDKDKWYVTPISEYADQRFAFAAEKAEVEFTTKAIEEGVEVTLVNKSQKISYINLLKVKNTRGELVIPAFWSDNFFTLLPGETKVVTCKVKGTFESLLIEFENR